MNNTKRYTVKSHVIAIQNVDYNLDEVDAEFGEHIKTLELIRTEILDSEKDTLIGIIQGDHDMPALAQQITDIIETYERNGEVCDELYRHVLTDSET